MRKILAVVAAAMCCIGCANNNAIIVDNNAAGAIDFNFRAQIYTINPGESKPLPTDIPNGTYEINIGIVDPYNTKTWSVSPAGASFNFSRNNTKYRAEFGSSYDPTASNYAVTWNFTSTDNKASVTGP